MSNPVLPSAGQAIAPRPASYGHGHPEVAA
jgi:hypothetical protein